MDKHEVVREMLAWADQYGHVEFTDLVWQAKRRSRTDWFEVLCSEPAVVLLLTEYLHSKNEQFERDSESE